MVISKRLKIQEKTTETKINIYLLKIKRTPSVLIEFLMLYFCKSNNWSDLKDWAFKKIQEESSETKIRHLFVENKRNAINTNWIFYVAAL